MKISLLGLIAVFASCAPTVSETSRVPVSVKKSNDVSLVDRIYRDLNSYRAASGKSHLRTHSGLDAIAQKHCDYLANNIGSGGLTMKSINHKGFEGRSLAARQAYRISTIGENIVTSTDHSSKNLLRLLINSKDHNYTMLSDWTYVGVGTAYTPSGLVISTQIFGTSESFSHLEMSNRFNRVR